MNPGNYDITAYRGSTFSLNLTATDELGEVNFEATYTGAELKVWPLWAEEKGASGDPLFEMSTINSKIVFMGTTLTLQASESALRALTFKSGVYELKLLNDEAAAPIVDTLLEGKFLLEGLG